MAKNPEYLYNFEQCLTRRFPNREFQIIDVLAAIQEVGPHYASIAQLLGRRYSSVVKFINDNPNVYEAFQEAKLFRYSKLREMAEMYAQAGDSSLLRFVLSPEHQNQDGSVLPKPERSYGTSGSGARAVVVIFDAKNKDRDFSAQGKALPTLIPDNVETLVAIPDNDRHPIRCQCEPCLAAHPYEQLPVTAKHDEDCRCTQCGF